VKHSQERRQVKHCQKCANKHGVYGADRFSVRAYLRTLAMLVERVEKGNQVYLARLDC